MAQVRVKRGRNSLVLDVVNVSESGALVDLGSLDRPNWVRPGRTVEMILFVLDEDAELAPINVWADIVRVVDDPTGVQFGVCFQDPDGTVAASILRLAEAAAPPRPAAQPPPLPSRRLRST